MPYIQHLHDGSWASNNNKWHVIETSIDGLRINDGRGDVACHNDRASFGDDLILNAAHFSIILRNKYKPQM